MYQMTAKVRLSEADHTKKITFPGIVNYFQDCSIFQSEALGVGFEHLERQKAAWVLNAWQIVVERYPMIGEEIMVSTWATGFHGIYGNRNFKMCDREGNILAWANSVWVYMDLVKGHPIRPDSREIELYGSEEALPFSFAPRKITLPTASVKCDSIPVRRSDIDPNEHVNNCHYIQMALEVLPESFTFRQVRVEYKRSARRGDVIYPLMAAEAGRTVIMLCDQEEQPYAIVELV